MLAQPVVSPLRSNGLARLAWRGRFQAQMQSSHIPVAALIFSLLYIYARNFKTSCSKWSPLCFYCQSKRKWTEANHFPKSSLIFSNERKQRKISRVPWNRCNLLTNLATSRSSQHKLFALVLSYFRGSFINITVKPFTFPVTRVSSAQFAALSAAPRPPASGQAALRCGRGGRAASCGVSAWSGRFR